MSVIQFPVKEQKKEDEIIVFKDKDVVLTCDSENRLEVHIPLSVILKKLPKTNRVRSLYKSQEEIDAAFAEHLEGVRYKTFLNLHCQRRKRGTISLSAYEAVLNDLANMAAYYGKSALEKALFSCTRYGEPEKATVNYIRAILKNQKEKKDEPERTTPKSDYQQSVASAVAGRRSSSGM